MPLPEPSLPVAGIAFSLVGGIAVALLIVGGLMIVGALNG
jgi:hypothetical protein